MASHLPLNSENALTNRKLSLFQLVLAALCTLAGWFVFPAAQSASAVFIVPLMFAAFYLWLGIAFFFIDLVWKLFAKPEERLFASVMLGSSVFVTAMLLAFYWLIEDSLDVGGTVIYAIAAYCVFAVVRWFRRHTASYYAALEASRNSSDTPPES